MGTARGHSGVPRFYLRSVLSPVSDPQLREATIDLFARAVEETSRENVDVCVFSTPRVANLYYLLLQAGLPEIPCRVITGREFLTYLSSDEWHGKRVLILDDTVFLGSSLALMVKELRQLVADGEVQVNAICIDKDSASQSLVRYCKISHAVQRESAAVENFSMELTASLHQGLVPPMGDYFMSSQIELSSANLDRILSNDGWMRADVTSPVIAQSEVFSYSLFPKESVSRAIDEALDSIIPGISKFVALSKMRAYGRTSGTRSLVRFVPVLVLTPFDPGLVRDALRTLEERIGAKTEVPLDKWSSAARHRFVQLIMSGVVAREFHRATVNGDVVQFEELARNIVDTKALKITYGRATSRFALGAVEHFVKSPSAPPISLPIGELADDKALPRVFFDQDGLIEKLLDKTAKSLQRTVKIPHEVHDAMIIRTGNDFVNEVAAIFNTAHNELELPEEAAIRRMSAQEFFKEYESPEKRKLGIGVSISGLGSLIPENECPLSGFAIVSLAVDICLDIGIIVPSTTYISEYKAAVRLYHLGENAFFTSDRGDLTYYPTTVATVSQAEALA
ncbi:hypothetical protein [Mycolicibacterium sp. HS_4_1]